MDNRSIGVFDSGLGGLTAVREIMKTLPGESIVYFGDTARVPYGTRSEETIINYVRDDIELLLKHNVKMIVSACGTASSVALPVIAKDYDIPVVGVVEPASMCAAKASRNGKIGIIGTGGTIKSGKYEKRIKELRSDAEVFAKACPLFVPLVENGHSDTEVARLVAEEYLCSLKEEGVDTLVLGCTHYPLLKGVISGIMGTDTYLVDPGAETAHYIKELLIQSNSLAEGDGAYKFLVSDSPGDFIRLGGAFLSRNLDFEVTKVEI